MNLLLLLLLLMMMVMMVMMIHVSVSKLHASALVWMVLKSKTNFQQSSDACTWQISDLPVVTAQHQMF